MAFGTLALALFIGDDADRTLGETRRFALQSLVRQLRGRQSPGAFRTASVRCRATRLEGLKSTSRRHLSVLAIGPSPGGSSSVSKNATKASFAYLVRFNGRMAWS